MTRADARGNQRGNHWAAKAHHIYKPGEMVAGRYGVMRELASGGMAEVYEVVDSQIGELRALKTTNARYTDSPKIVDRMILEFKALRKMSHPNLVRVYDAGIDEGQPYYVMELLSGHALTDLANGRCLSPGVALSVIRQVAEGVHALHEMGTVHRDLKPDNIFVLEAADSGEHGCKVLDLGVAKHADSSTTSSNIALGTVTYMAPEQTVGQRVDARTDVYALALILYELLAGIHPLQGRSWPRSAQEWAQRQREMEPPSLADLDIGVHPVLSNLVQRAMAKKPAQRFGSAAELANQIRAATVMLRELGQLGPSRIQPFRPKEQTAAQVDSGPQPIARVRPPNTPEPSAGLAFRRTDEPEAIEPVPVRAEPPRVSARPDQRAERGTIKMLGQKGTIPLLDAPKMMVPQDRADPATPLPAPVKTKPLAPRSDGKPAWREVPRDQDLAVAKNKPRQNKVPQPKWQRQLFAEEPKAPPDAGADEQGWPPIAWWLKAMALGLAISLVLVAIAVVFTLLQQRTP